MRKIAAIRIGNEEELRQMVERLPFGSFSGMRAIDEWKHNRPRPTVVTHPEDRPKTAIGIAIVGDAQVVSWAFYKRIMWFRSLPIIGGLWK